MFGLQLGAELQREAEHEAQRTQHRRERGAQQAARGDAPGEVAVRGAEGVHVAQLGPARRARKPMSESKRWFYGIDRREKRRPELWRRKAAESQVRTAAQGLLQLSAPTEDATAAPAEDATAAPAEDATAAPAEDADRQQREVEASMYDGMTDEQMLTLLGV